VGNVPGLLPSRKTESRIARKVGEATICLQYSDSSSASLTLLCFLVAISRQLVVCCSNVT
jgi:hypothetical protein